MTQASNPNTASLDTTGSIAKAIHAGKAMPNMNLTSLLAIVQMLVDSTGVLRVETPYHSWRLFMWGGSLALIDEEAELATTIVRKLRTHKLQIPQANLLTDNLAGIQLYEAINEIYLSQEEQVRPLLKEILFESLLAIYLETNFTVTWHPLAHVPQLFNSSPNCFNWMGESSTTKICGIFFVSRSSGAVS